MIGPPPPLFSEIVRGAEDVHAHCRGGSVGLGAGIGERAAQGVPVGRGLLCEGEGGAVDGIGAGLVWRRP